VSLAAADGIIDFVRGTDKVVVSATSGGLRYTGQLLAIELVANANGTATTADGQFVYNTTTRVPVVGWRRHGR
jgi:hypothetical protein